MNASSMNVDLDQERLRKHLGPELYRHSLGVAETALELAERYGADKRRAYLAGLVHDYAKNLSAERLLALASHFGLPIDRITRAEPRLLHAPVGAALLPLEMKITDTAVLNAIACHTTGSSRMSLLARIVYLADVIEPSRDYPGVERLRQEAFQDFTGALLAAVENTIGSVLARGLLLHPRSVSFRNQLLLEKRMIGG